MGEEEDRPGADATEALGALLGYRAYARRWVFLLVLSLLNFSNAAVVLPRALGPSFPSLSQTVGSVGVSFLLP